VTWQLASFALLACALAAGFGWYERARPPARLVALVATLAALGALGRIAFGALPNVKPLTDIALISGFALGAGPGFAVGALAALTSNFFFGQGPWTPWEMAAWGATGVAGALLARATGGRMGRVPLAAVCGVAGLGHGVFMDFGDWVLYSDHTAAWYAARAGTSLPFNLAHAIGNVVFCLAFGPALLRALQRFRTRMQTMWHQAVPAAPLAAAALALLAGGILASAPSPAQAASPAGYLLSAQNRDGGFGAAPGQRSTQLHTGWAALGLAAAGHNPRDVRRGGGSAIDAIRRGLAGLNDTGELERTILVVRAAGLDTRRFGGRDLVGTLRRRQRADGALSEQVNWTAFAVFAFRAAGYPPSASPVRRAATWLVRQQNRDGGFNFAGRGGPSGIDDTSAPLQALVAAGRRGSSAVARGVAFLRAQQNGDGGFPLNRGGASNAQSAAWAVQAFVAAGRNPGGVRRGGRSPLDYLHSLTASDGSVRYSRTSGQTPVWVTAQALTALALRPFPLGPVARSRSGAEPAPGAARGASGASAAAAAGKRPARGGAGQGAAGPPGALVQAARLLGLVAGYLLRPVG
jgi:energy-coupling factor transport system substrate-specific component